jgi:hypothetical protein
MPFTKKIAAVLIGLLALPACVYGGSIGGTYYSPQYDYREFFAISDGRNFNIDLAGVAFPTIDPRIVARDLLPVMQAAKPRPALTFTYDVPVERPSTYYRLVLIFNPALDLNSNQVCNGARRFRPGYPNLFYVYAVYCRSEQVLSETTAQTPANGPTDPRIAELFRELFQVVFTDSPAYRNPSGNRTRP